MLFYFLLYFLRYFFVFFCPGLGNCYTRGGVANMDDIVPIWSCDFFCDLLFSALELQQGLPSVMDRLSLLVRVQMESDLAADGEGYSWFLLTTPPVSDNRYLSRLKLNALSFFY